MQNKPINEAHISTLGLDFITTTFEGLKGPMRVKIWDTAGQERFRTITESFYRKADGIVMVFDVSNRESFLGIKSW